MFGYRTSRLISFGTGSAAAAVALVMVLAPAAMAVTLHAPYSGVSSKFGYGSFNGCEKNSGGSTWSFFTGVGGAKASSSAKTCAKSLAGVGKSSYGNNQGGIDGAFNVKLPTGYHHVAANWAFNWAVAGSESMAGGCPPPVPFNYHYNYSSSSYAVWYNSTGASQYCSASTSANMWVYSYLDDITGGNQYNFTYHTIVDVSMSTYNSTYWSCYNDTYWYSSSGYSYYTGCYGYNSTTTTYAYFFNDTSGASYGNYINPWSGPTSYKNASLSMPTIWYNNTYTGTHHYAIWFEFGAGTSSYVSGWSHAASTSSANMMTLGDYAKLVSVVIT